MNKQDLVKILAKENSLSLQKSQQVITSLFKIISETLYCGERICVAGFGTFGVKFYPSTTKIHHKTRAEYHIPSRFVPKFWCSKVLKKRFLMPKN